MKEIKLEDYKFKLYSYDKLDADFDDEYNYVFVGIYRTKEEAKLSIKNRINRKQNELKGYHIFDEKEELCI